MTLNMTVWTDVEGKIFKNTIEVDQTILCFFTKNKKKMFKLYEKYGKRAFLNNPLVIPSHVSREDVIEMAQKISNKRDWSKSHTTEEELVQSLDFVLLTFVEYGFEVPTREQILALPRLLANMTRAACAASEASKKLNQIPF